MSGSVEAPAAGALLRRLVQPLARPSLCVLLAIMPAGCLVTSVPEFEEPLKTPPFLIPSSADPDIREFLLVEQQDDEGIVFRAKLLSEDNGDNVDVALYVDYGKTNGLGHPWWRVFPYVPIDPGTIADGPRQFSVEWKPDADFFNSCRTITMMVAHEFDFRGCPMRLDDSSHLVWQALFCSSKESCGEIDPLTSCPNSSVDPLVSCPEVASELDVGAGDGGSP